MKRSILFLLVALLFTGCAFLPTPQTDPTAHTAEPTSQAPAPSTAATVPTEVDSSYAAPMVSLSAAPEYREFSPGSGNTLLRYTGQLPELLLEDPQISEAVTLALIHLSGYESSQGPALLKQAQDAQSYGGSAGPITLSNTFQVLRLDRGVISLLFTQVSDGGDTRTGVNMSAVTYELLSGRQLELRDVLLPEYSAQDLAQSIISSLEKPAQEGLLYADYAYVIQDLFGSNTPVKHWYLSPQGLCFFFPPYEIAPYSMGFVTATVPYEALGPLLRPEYFPAETIGLQGIPLLEPLPEDLDAYTQFRELNLAGPEAPQWLLHTQGAVEDLRLNLGGPDREEGLPAATVFACSTLCQTDALVIQGTRQQLQELTLTYSSGGEVQTLPLSQLLTQ